MLHLVANKEQERDWVVLSVMECCLALTVTDAMAENDEDPHSMISSSKDTERMYLNITCKDLEYN